MQKNRLNLTFLKLIISQIGEFRFYYLGAILCLIFTHLIQSELPLMASRIADMVSNDHIKSNTYKFFLCAIGIIIFRTLSRVLFFYPARLMQKELRHELINKLENVSPFRYRKYNSGQLFQYLSGDIDQIRALIGFVGLQGGNFIIAMIILIPKIISFNSKLILALLPLLIAFIIFTYVVNKNKIYFKKVQEAQGEVQNLIIESYKGSKTIKNYQSEEIFVNKFKSISLKELFYFYKSSIGITYTMPLIAFGIGMSLLWGAHIIKSQNLGPSALIFFSGFIFLFMEPLSYLSWVGVVISRSRASWIRLSDFNQVLISESEIELTLKELNIDSRKKNNHFILPYWDKFITLDFNLNSWTALISSTGHGKSELLLKLSELMKSQQYSISFVSQEPYLYNDSVINNIFLGKIPNKADINEAIKLLKILGLDYVENDLEKLLILEVGENGKRLSGGQIKRLCLIRSIMSNADYFIWDDPFSSVDLILEKEIMTKLKAENILKNKTIIFTTHRFSTAKYSEKIYLLDKDIGIVENGELSKLLINKSSTYEFFKKQMV